MLENSLQINSSKKYCGIYAIINTTTGRMYIGQSQDMRSRLETHRRHIFEGKHPNRNINKDLQIYNASHYTFKILEAGCKPEELNDIEYALIRKHYRRGDLLYNIVGVPGAKQRRRQKRSIITVSGTDVRRHYRKKTYQPKRQTKQDYIAMYGFPKDPSNVLRRTGCMIQAVKGVVSFWVLLFLFIFIVMVLEKVGL